LGVHFAAAPAGRIREIKLTHQRRVLIRLILREVRYDERACQVGACGVEHERAAVRPRKGENSP
jgi:hypothetical protein